MADIELVIKISEEDYDFVKKQVADGITNPLKICIANGTVLAKGHGRLIDADKLKFEREDFDTYFDYSNTFDEIDNAPTIIEAEKAESGE